VQRHHKGHFGLVIKDLYNYKAYLETLLTYGHEASKTHHTNAFWYPYDGGFFAHKPPADTRTAVTRPRWS
jgi:hypothetical protein